MAGHGLHPGVETAPAQGGMGAGRAGEERSALAQRTASGKLLAVVLRLHPRQRAPLHGRHLHAAFLRAVAAVDPALAAELHAPNQPRPFTLAVLPEPAAAGETLVRLSLLDDRLIAACRAWFVAAPHLVQLGGGSYELAPALATAPAGAWAGATTWAGLRAVAASASEVVIEFATPTCFSRGEPDGRQRLELFPAPEWVWESWARQWARWGPGPLDPAGVAATARRWLLVAEYALHTAEVDHGRYRLRGFVGRVRYVVDPAAPEADARLLSMLADFARFAGTGYKTAMGMGLTRRDLTPIC